ncbi:BspA family leucine-rich repeat surface protein [Mycoplasma cottewii]|uniref:BspA family leucine-rich repeat surface protein n=1 Tax=Mycoplasma cottewii TaxID=51364 RepID=A0ABY5TXN6_9MOLU|nr:BspA family leucine-rich repeat surface protein [Mycoplasma cottewii]UWD35402.1 BspA family leucine-rich repeat surface protein [Mycoplasma cottewii]
MNKLLKHLTAILSLGSSSILATSVVSCTVSNNQKVNDENKIDDQNNEADSKEENEQDEEIVIQKFDLSEIIKNNNLGTIEEENLTEEKILKKIKWNIEIKDEDLKSLSVKKSKFSAKIVATPESRKFIGEIEVKFIPVFFIGREERKPAVYNEDKTVCLQIGYRKNRLGGWTIERFEQTTNTVPEELPWFINSLSDAFYRNKNTSIKGLDKWDTSNVVYMSSMFNGAKNFNQDISNWDTSNAESMSNMFYQARNFNQDIGNWDTSKVTNMYSMFTTATNFNQDISTKEVTRSDGTRYMAWDTSNVKDMSFMFANADSFDQDISNWNVENVKQFGGFDGSVNGNRRKSFYKRPRFNYGRNWHFYD